MPSFPGLRFLRRLPGWLLRFGIAVSGFLLLVLLTFQVWLLHAGDFPLPGPVRSALDRELARHGLVLDFSSARLSPAGRIQLTDTSLSSFSLPEPLLSADLITFRLSRPALLVGRIQPESLQIEGLTLHLSALFSPSGRSEAILSDGRLALRFGENRRLHLDAVNARLASFPFTARGEIILPPARPRDTPPDFVAWLRAYHRHAPAVVRFADTLAKTGIPSAHLDLRPDSIVLALSADRLRPTVPGVALDFGPSRIRLDLSYTRPASLTLHARHALATFPASSALPIKQIHLEHLAASLDLPSLPFLLLHTFSGATDTLLSNVSLHLAASSLTAPDFPPVPVVATFQAAPAHAPGAITLTASTRFADNPWHLHWTGYPLDLSGELHALGTVSPALLDSVAPFVPSPLPVEELLTLQSPAHLDVHASFGPRGRFLHASGHGHTGPVVARGVPFDRTAGEFTWDGETLVATNILLSQDTSQARGSYLVNQRTRNFRFLLEGHIYPTAISPWFKAWWTDFWQRFGFSGPPAEASVEVSGTWRQPDLTRVFVAASASDVSVQQTPLDYLETRLFIRPGWFDGLHLEVHRAGGTARGRFTLSTDHRANRWRSLSAEITGNLPLPTLASLTAELDPDFFNPYVFTTPPSLLVVGEVFGPASDRAGQSDLTITIDGPGPFTFQDFPLADLATTVRLQNDTLSLSPLNARFASGQLSGRATLEGPPGHRQIAFAHSLDQAQLDSALRILATYTARRRGDSPSSPRPPDRPIEGGLLNLQFVASGPLNQLDLLHGQGQARITQASLGQVGLLGPLSELLRTSGIGLTSFSFDAADTRFALAEGRLTFQDLALTGPSARIEANGHYQLADGALDFRAKLYPFDERTGLLSGAAGLLLTPLSSVLEFRLTGDVAQPRWNFIYGPRAIFRSLLGNDIPPSPESPSPSSPD